MSGKENTRADLLSRIPKQLEERSVKVEQGVDDKAYRIGVINFNKLKDHPRLESDEEGDAQMMTDPYWTEGIEKEQADSEIAALREKVEAGETTKYAIIEERLYYLSGRDEEVKPKLYVPKSLRPEILEQCHERLGHMGTDRTYDLIGRKYYWPKLYGEVTNYVRSCVVCQSQSRRQEMAPLEGMDVLSFPFEKVSMDVSGPYRETA